MPPQMDLYTTYRQYGLSFVGVLMLLVRKGLVDETKVHLTVYIPIDGRYTLDP